MNNKEQSLYSKILMHMEIEILIQIMYGRILTIISNNQIMSSKIYQL